MQTENKPSTSGLTGAVRTLIAPFFTRRFMKFASVGFSGIGVNLAVLVVLADVLGLHNNLASALAIEVSILSNFLFNEYWTFSDRRMGNGGLVKRAMRFNLVSLIGALVQWSIFVYANLAWALMTFDTPQLMAYHGEVSGVLGRWILHPILEPPEVGGLMYASQLLGIGVATFWNFLVNVRWTWARVEDGDGAEH